MMFLIVYILWTYYILYKCLFIYLNKNFIKIISKLVSNNFLIVISLLFCKLKYVIYKTKNTKGK